MTVKTAIQSASGYKPFIDGLRALSILAVVAYHVGISQIPGGFVGVDIFFVISGFLIVTHLLSSLHAESFSFGEFWARRALRILPPYLLVIAVCALVAPFILVLPKELTEFGAQAAYSAAMIVNHYFLGQQGYFDGLADTKPLLHLWSLAVEEQFYLVAPVLMYALYAACRRLSPLPARLMSALVVAAIFGLSIYGCVTLSGGGAGKNYAFFLMPLRAWEFIAGGVIAFVVPYAQRLPRSLLDVLSIAGLWLVADAILTYTGASPYPGAKALAPVIGAVLIILCGVAQPKVIVAQVLSFRPFVLIGLVSYAWYLWHWPLLTFGRIYNFGERSIPFDSAMAGISLALACATYVFVDKTVLAWRKGLKNGAGWKHAGGALAVCVPICLVGVYLSQSMAPTVARNFTEAQVPKPASKSATCDLHVAKDLSKCLSTAGGKPIGLLIGDSHADAAYRGISKHAEESRTTLATLSSGGCAAIFNVHINNPDIAMRERCESGRRNAMGLINEKLSPKFAILFSRWAIYGGRGYYSLGEEGGTIPFENTKEGFVSKVKSTIDYLRAKGVERILVIGPVPIFKTSAPPCLLRSLRYGANPDSHCSVGRVSVDEARNDVVSWLDEAAKGQDGVRFVDPISRFCDSSVCRSYGDEGVLYTDTNHISDAGLERIYQGDRETFDWVFGRETAAHVSN